MADTPLDFLSNQAAFDLGAPRCWHCHAALPDAGAVRLTKPENWAGARGRGSRMHGRVFCNRGCSGAWESTLNPSTDVKFEYEEWP